MWNSQSILKMCLRGVGYRRIHLTDQESQKLRSFLSEYQDVFSKNDGCTDYIEHSIDTGDQNQLRWHLVG